MGNRTCAVDDCEKPAHCRGWCRIHYDRWRRHGDPLTLKRYTRPIRTPETIASADEKVCSVCGRAKPLGDFPRRKDSPDGHAYRCRICRQVAADRKKYGEDAERRRRRAEHYKRWRESLTPEQRERFRRQRALKAYYGISVEDYDALSEAQGGCCAICREPHHETAQKKYLSVDHCHETGGVRGLLCSNCNVGLGQFRDSPQLLAAAISYLAQHQTE